MTLQPIQTSRIQALNGIAIGKGRYVLYWMQQAQRAEVNHALEYAIQQANALGQCLLVGFGLTDDYPEANLRHYTFMLEGLRETQRSLAGEGVKMVVRRGSPVDVVLELGRKASLIVCDRGYLRHQKAWRDQVARSAPCPVIQVETDVIVPLSVVSGKAEYAARTIRPRINRHLNEHLRPFESSVVEKSSLKIDVNGLDLSDVGAVLKTLSLDGRVGAVSRVFKGGTAQAKARFDAFLNQRLKHYVSHRNQPATDDTSHMSPYLHFGQISPLYLALALKAAGRHRKAARDAYLEELVVRRELAVNFVNYTPNYDSFSSLPRWARKTLAEHRNDRREITYTRRQLEAAETHDEYWNAAMREMSITGFMHNHMRMYWGKKILEWSRTPEHAFRTTLAINNKYFLDGRDANSYAGVGWVFGVHDRAWFERTIFGKVRYMAASGLERKCHINGYVDKVNALATRA